MECYKTFAWFWMVHVVHHDDTHLTFQESSTALPEVGRSDRIHVPLYVDELLLPSSVAHARVTSNPDQIVHVRK